MRYAISRDQADRSRSDLEITTFLLPLRGRNFPGIDSHVLRPIITALGLEGEEEEEGSPVVTA